MRTTVVSAPVHASTRTGLKSRLVSAVLPLVHSRKW
jgi:hypothetical protein